MDIYHKVNKDLILQKRNHGKHGFSFLLRKEKNMYQQNGNILIIYDPKELDHHKAEEIKKETLHIFQKATIRYVVFDFKATEFMDSSGIGMLMGRYRQVNLIGGKVFVTGVREEISRILMLSGIYRIVKQYETLEEALEDLSR